MAEIRKDILIAIRAEKKLDAIGETVSELEKLQKRINDLKASPITVPGFEGIEEKIKSANTSISSFGSNVKKSLGETKDAAISAAEALSVLEKEAGVALSITKNVQTIKADGTRGEAIQAKSSPESGITATADQNTGAIKITENIEAATAAQEKQIAAAERALAKGTADARAAAEEEATIASELELKKEQAFARIAAAEEEDHIQGLLSYRQIEVEKTDALEAEIIKREIAFGKSQDKAAADAEASLRRQQTAQGNLQAQELSDHEAGLRENTRRDNSSEAFQGAVAAGAKVQPAQEVVGDDGSIKKINVAYNELTGTTYKLNEANGVLKAMQDREQRPGLLLQLRDEGRDDFLSLGIQRQHQPNILLHRRAISAWMHSDTIDQNFA